MTDCAHPFTLKASDQGKFDMEFNEGMFSYMKVDHVTGGREGKQVLYKDWIRHTLIKQDSGSGLFFPFTATLSLPQNVLIIYLLSPIVQTLNSENPVFACCGVCMGVCFPSAPWEM